MWREGGKRRYLALALRITCFIGPLARPKVTATFQLSIYVTFKMFSYLDTTLALSSMMLILAVTVLV